MNHDMLENIEYLRERSDVSYEEAMELLEKYDGNVMRSLVELEKQGRVYGRSYVSARQESCNKKQQERKSKTCSFIKNVTNTCFVVQKEGENDAALKISAPIVAGAAIFAPQITLAATALGIASGYKLRVENKEEQKEKEDKENA